MAERRMFTKKITESDAFLDMPMSTQCLYFHLNMAADDEGFVNSPKKIMRQIGAKEDDFRLLIAKSFILVFESGVIVIKHWKMHNYIQSDRFKPTDYQEEKSMLSVKPNKAYTLSESECIQDGYSLDTQVRLGKESIDKESKGKSSIGKFIPPTVEEVHDYCCERGNYVDPQAFVDFYESKGWMVGRNKMKDWKACVRTWERNKKQPGKKDILDEMSGWV